MAAASLPLLCLLASAVWKNLPNDLSLLIAVFLSCQERLATVPVASIAAAVSHGDDIPWPLGAAGIPLGIADRGSQTAVDNGFHLDAFVLVSDSSGIGTLVKTAAEKTKLNQLATKPLLM